MTSKQSTNATKGPGAAATAYLFVYNFCQVLGWLYILFSIIRYHLQQSNELSLWETVKIPTCIFQNAAALEILHAALRLVPSNVVITTFQVFSRVFLVCGVLLATPTAQLSTGVSLALTAWSISEIIRYLYYALNILGLVPYLLTWCRYTFFYALYPIGVLGELLCLYAAQSDVSKTNLWSISLPNAINFTFCYHYFMMFIMLLYIPLFPQMYLHMVAQRRKIIGSAASSKKVK